jgi:hypothetical protein
MKADDADEFAGRDDFGFLPELWQMALMRRPSPLAVSMHSWMML